MSAGPPPGTGPVPGTLYVVATPIGNLGDITLRAIEVLRAVALVAAEDTRLTRRLWGRYEIHTKLVSYHARSPESRTEALLERLASGQDVALVSDAGTPLVSDPGEALVSTWAARGGRVVPIPGASAALSALVASGISAARWGFEGFLPRRGAERRERLARIASDERATVLFEAPGRTAGTLRDLARSCGDDRAAALCRELTKLHEEVRRGSLAVLAAGALDDAPRGEVTIVVAGAPSGFHAPGSAGTLTADQAGAALDAARGQVDALVAAGQSRSSAARQVARESGLPRRELFAQNNVRKRRQTT